VQEGELFVLQAEQGEQLARGTFTKADSRAFRWPRMNTS
jgi:hypothetical protein